MRISEVLDIYRLNSLCQNFCAKDLTFCLPILHKLFRSRLVSFMGTGKVE